jgi:outer membrane protein assembly factor BamB
MLRIKRVVIAVFLPLVIFFFSTFLNAGDWPIYKGNIYFTGNNDEIVVRNNNLKWLFQADERVFNPVVSDGRIYFVDMAASVYCVDEEYGKLIWKVPMKSISSQFASKSRSAGKVKYPLIKSQTLFLTDPVAIYALDKRTGRVLWARTGMREEETPVQAQGLSGSRPLPMVDGIYSDPILHEEGIFYGTRNMFIARETGNGHLQWDNRNIKSYSGFPTFYDNRIFTQSMDYATGRYTVYCLEAGTGREIWKRDLAKPMTIIPPVIYRQRAYIPTGRSMNCLDLKDGSLVWSREYPDYITSNPSFTDRALIFSVANSDIYVTDPENGSVKQKVDVGPRSGPQFITIRDQIYVANNVYSADNSVNGRSLPYGTVRAINFNDRQTMWDYKTPFPGAVSQPVASGGILFLPCGNYLYAIGTEYYRRVVDGGSGFAVVPDKKSGETPPERSMDSDNRKGIAATRQMDISITGGDKRPIPAEIEIRKREKGRLVYNKRQRLDGEGKVEVPSGDDVEALITAPDHVPKKIIIRESEKERTVLLDKIREDNRL